MEESQQAEPSLRFPDDPAVPDVYTEGVSVQASYQSIGMVFTRQSGTPAVYKPVVTVRMSPQQALVFSKMLQQVMQDFQTAFGIINIPEDALPAKARGE